MSLFYDYCSLKNEQRVQVFDRCLHLFYGSIGYQTAISLTIDLDDLDITVETTEVEAMIVIQLWWKVTDA